MKSDEFGRKMLDNHFKAFYYWTFADYGKLLWHIWMPIYEKEKGCSSTIAWIISVQRGLWLRKRGESLKSIYNYARQYLLIYYN